MERKAMSCTDHYEAIMHAMRARGLLLAAYDAAGRANAMTIGWGAMGTIWSMPVWIVLVRPSRYTYACIEHARAFTVNVPAADQALACDLCGTRSGREGDKLAASGLTAVRSSAVAAPILDPCPIAFECQVVHHNDVLPTELAREIQQGAYANGDYHRLYFGKILAAQAAANAAALL